MEDQNEYLSKDKRNSLNESVRTYSSRYAFKQVFELGRNKPVNAKENNTKGRLLKSIDAIRILSAYNEALRRAEIVTALPFMIENISVLRFAFGPELIEAIERHCRIQSAYKDTRHRLEHLINSRAKVVDRIQMLKASAEDHQQASISNLNYPKQSLFDYIDSINMEAALMVDGEEEEEEEDGEEPSTDTRDMLNIKSIDQPGILKLIPETMDDKPSYQASESDVQDSNTTGDNGDIALSELSDVTVINDDSKQSSSKNMEKRYTKLSFRSAETPTKTDMMDLEITLSIYEPQIEELIKQLAQISRKVVHSIKNVLRLFTTNPMASKTLGKYTIVRNPRSVEFLELMRELGGILKSRLSVSPEEEKTRMEYLDSVYKREERTKKYIAILEGELQTARSEMDDEFRAKLETIENLKTDIMQIEAFSNENIRRTLGNAEKIEFNCSKNSEQRTRMVREDIAALQSKMEEISKIHRADEASLRTDKYKLETELETLVKKYDTEMGNKMDEFEKLEIIYYEERKILADTEDRFAELEKEYMALMDERLLARRKQEWNLREDKRFLTQVVTIQSFWRSYVVRKAIQKELKRLAKEEKRREKLQKALEKKKQAAKSPTEP
ncbi:IQ domain-containing protein D [Biomphalaria pfeifferi]|uniref:Dynein regulatory complex protein 10 n=1 Tax=Biomphalaria pfeifferi TaxID=112525 RepID=A0AAD8FEI1_BIOPF|nr:IQ domain-containing protein D [Biomphalaria pfeifferi]